MKRPWQTPIAALAGLFLTYIPAMPQTYTISAKPGGVNYIEGQAYLNGQLQTQQGLKSTFLNANDILSTDSGKAEVLLTPGVFLRIGDNSAVRMIVPSLIKTQVEVTRGEAILEAAGLNKDNTIQIISHGASIIIAKNGLYRFNADGAPTAATIDGKAQVYFGQKKIDLGKGRETVLSENLKAQKFDTKKEDELYAWSNVRSEYNAAASYQSATAISRGNNGAGYGPGWLWNSAYDTWAWLPGTGALYSPFGWGFYSPSTVAYAPVVTGPVFRGGHWVHRDGDHNGNNPSKPEKDHRDWQRHQWIGAYTHASVPVNVNRPPALEGFAGSPSGDRAARAAAARSFADAGFHTATGRPVADFSGRHVDMFPNGSTPNRDWERNVPAGSSAAQSGGAGAAAPTAHQSGRWSGGREGGGWSDRHSGDANWSGGRGGNGDWPGRGGHSAGWSGAQRGSGSGDWGNRGGHAGGGGSPAGEHHTGGGGDHPSGAPSSAGGTHTGPGGK